MTRYRKFIVALVGVAVMVAASIWGNDNAVLQAVIGLATALGVYQTPNAA